MRKLTVYYDETCGFCRYWRDWFEAQPKFLALEFVSRERARDGVLRGADELVVVDDGGGVYRGEKAYVMALYALREWRELSLRLSSPLWRGLARRVFQLVATNRYRLSRFVSHEARLGEIRNEEHAGRAACATVAHLAAARAAAAAGRSES